MEDLLVLIDRDDRVLGSCPKLSAHTQKLLHRAFSIFIYDPKTDRILLQKRALGKYHSGGLWSNSCCSHPRYGEPYAVALARRQAQELGITIPEQKAQILLLPGGSDDLLTGEGALPLRADFQPMSGETGPVHSDVSKPSLPLTEDCRPLPADTLRNTFLACGRFIYFADYGELAEHELDRVFIYLCPESTPIIPDPEEIAETAWVKRADIRTRLKARPEAFSAWFPKAFSLADAGIEALARCDH